MSENDPAPWNEFFEEEKGWPYPLLPRCPVCRSPSLLYFPLSRADTRVYCTRCKWKAAIKHMPERRPTLDGLPDVPSFHETSKPPLTDTKTPRGRMTVSGIGPPLAPADPIELGPAGGTKKPSTNFVDKPDPDWASKPIPGVPYPAIETDVEVEKLNSDRVEKTKEDEVLELGDEDLPGPEEWEESGSPLLKK